MTGRGVVWCGIQLRAFYWLIARWIRRSLRRQIPPPRTPPPPRADASAPLHAARRHRSYPFLLVDRVLEWEAGVYAVGYKCVTANDNFFPGHFPQRAIMPGVLQVRVVGG